MLETVLGQRAARIMLLILTLIAAVAALRLAADILAPLVFALVLGIVVSPLSDRLARWGLPRVLSAAATLLLTTAAVVLVFVILEPLLSRMVERLPRLKMALEGWLDALSEMLRGLQSFGDVIDMPVDTRPEAVQEDVLSVSDALWLAPNFGAQVFVFLGTLFFFVLTRDDIYRAAGSLTETLYRADAVVSRYFAAVTMVNVGVGVATAAAMMVIGLDYALLWGLAAGVLNYILYLGPMIIIAGLLVAGLVQFWDATAFLPPAAFLMINIAEAQFVTPLVVGQHMKMNPLVVFLGIVFGLWLWGPIGAIVALPVLLWFGLMLRPPVGQAARSRTA